MIVISDTSPLHYLIICRAESILPRMFGEIVIPEAVAREMAHESAPHVVREYLLHSPGWMIIRTPRAQDASLRRLGAGEIEAISLAQELRADLLLVDDKEARKAAEARGLTCTGTLGVLKRAAELGLIDYDQILEALRGTSMRFPPEKGQ